MRPIHTILLAAALVAAPACKGDDAPSGDRPGETGEPAEPTLLTPPDDDLRAPDEFSVVFETTEGDVVVDVERALSPHGADRLYTLVQLGYFEDVAFFRVVDGFMAQVGIHGDPRVSAVWRERTIPDDPVEASNVRGAVTFAKSSMPNSRSTQIFFNYGDNSRLDSMGFSPVGKVRDMKPVDALHAGYGEGAPAGRGPSQQRIQLEGNRYLRESFPELDYIERARILEE